jgi:uncharacterized protein DUF839
MTTRTRYWSLLTSAAVAMTVLLATPAEAAVAGSPPRTVGPSTTTNPYVLPVAAGVNITSLLTVNDSGAAGNGYEMVGIPDGIGSRWERGKIVAYVNHELQATAGIARRHGQKGAFVAKLTINPKTLRVERGKDFINPGIRYWDYSTGRYSVKPSLAWTTGPAQSAEFGRFCSGSLTRPLQLVSFTSLRGYFGQLYFANEEIGDEGRSFAVTTDGDATQLPRLGLFSWENTLVAPTRGDTTLVIGNEDGGSGQLHVYIGRKQYRGSAVDKAGLTNGRPTVVDVLNEAVTNDAEFRGTYGKNNPVPVRFNDIDWTKGGTAQNDEAKTKGLSLNRIEDGSWDPRHPNDFYFDTTLGGVGRTTGTDPVTKSGTGRDGGGLWRLRFADVDRPELGATLELLLDGSESIGLNQPDNVTIDAHGNLLLQEDPGDNVHVSRIVAYRIADGATGVVARFDPTRFSRDAFLANQPEFLTLDEESSGIVPTSGQFGPDTFLFDAQVHTAKNLPPGDVRGTVQEYVENGQLLLLRVRDWNSIYG